MFPTIIRNLHIECILLLPINRDGELLGSRQAIMLVRGAVSVLFSARVRIMAEMTDTDDQAQADNKTRNDFI
jgi:hypothetical protein